MTAHSQMIGHMMERVKSRQATVGIVGMGYVGLPLMLRFAESGFKVIGFDIDMEKVEWLNKGASYIDHIQSEKIQSAITAGFKATADFAEAKNADALIICVPTPLTKQREPDLSFIVSTMRSLQPHLREGHIISLESTTYPGTTDEVLKPLIEEVGLKVGENCFLIFSPEREDPGNPKYDTRTIPKVVGGYSPNCLEVGMALYGQVIDKVIPVSSTRAAEMTKLLENIHRAVNIGLVNEMKIVADKMDIDIHEVIRAAATKPFGFTPFYPGPGLGGHCIPIDPFYLTWKAREYGVNTRFIELAGEVNTSMPQYVLTKLNDALNDRGKPLKGSRVLVLGLAYKKDVDDMRESPSLALMEGLRAKGAQVDYSDPYVPKFPKMREHSFDLSSVPLNAKNIADYDCVLLSTNHSSFDYPMILENANLIVDTRGAYLDPSDKVVKA